MATRVCPECGAQYVASVRRCIDCEVGLVDQVSTEEGEVAASPSPVGDGDRVSYELEHWGNQLKVSLEGMLDKAGIRRVWEVGALVVSAADSEAVEALIETVEGRDVDDLHELEEQLAFEIEGLDAESAADLDARLIAAGIAHAWSEEGELLVALEDEDEVTAIIDAVADGDVEDEGIDGLAANQALSEVFVAVDRIIKSPKDAKLVGRLEEAAAVLDPLGVPYGFSAQDWTDLKAEVQALVGAARGEEVEDLVVDAEIVDDDDLDDLDDVDAVEEPADGGPDGDDSTNSGDDASAEASEDHDEPTEEERLIARAEDLREQLLTWI